MALDFYFDVISPYSYLAVKRMPAFPVLSAADMRWIPVNLPKLIRDAGNTPPTASPQKARYLLQDIKRWAAALDVPLRMILPGSFDARPALALACMLEGADRVRFCTAAFDALWSGAVDPVHDADWLERIVAVQGLPAEWLRLDPGEGKARLRRNTEAALKAGCFGVPTFILRGEERPQMFWGVDRMEMLAAAMGKAGPAARRPDRKRPVRLLALSGSLRRASYNTALIEALRQLAPAEVQVVVFRHMGELPLFNPDLDDADIPAVSELRRELALADGLIIAGPEYAHGISGVLKNALDWLVSGEAFIGMPVALLNTSPRARHAQQALREVIATMSGVVIESASIAVPLLGSDLDAAGIAGHPEVSGALREALAVFQGAICDREDDER